MSNGIAVLMVSLTGYAFDGSADIGLWAMAFAMVVVDAALVAITIALGGSLRHRPKLHFAAPVASP